MSPAAGMVNTHAQTIWPAIQRLPTDDGRADINGGPVIVRRAHGMPARRDLNAMAPPRPAANPLIGRNFVMRDPIVHDAPTTEERAERSPNTHQPRPSAEWSEVGDVEVMEESVWLAKYPGRDQKSG